MTINIQKQKENQTYLLDSRVTRNSFDNEREIFGIPAKFHESESTFCIDGKVTKHKNFQIYIFSLPWIHFRTYDLYNSTWNKFLNKSKTWNSQQENRKTEAILHDTHLLLSVTAYWT